MSLQRTSISPLYQAHASTRAIQIIWQVLVCQIHGGTIFLRCRSTNQSLADSSKN
jgi:hypothetical protein